MQQCLVGGSLLSDCLSVQASWHCCSVAWHLAFTWHLLLGMLWTKAGKHLEPSTTACRNQVPGPSSLHPCSAGDRGLQEMLKTASSFFLTKTEQLPNRTSGISLKEWLLWSDLVRTWQACKNGLICQNTLYKPLTVSQSQPQPCNRTSAPCPGPTPG